MFISLNKKILYSILVFLFLITGLFFIIFINFYARNLQDRQNSLYLRNQYVVDLLYDNISLQKQLAQIYEKNPEISPVSRVNTVSQGINLTQKELSREQKLNAELQKNYNNNREALKVGAEILGFSLFIVILFIFLLIFMLDYWVIRPIEKLIEISRKVSLGIFSSRINIEKGRFQDEFDILYSAFNKMLDNTEYNIEETKARESFLQKLIDAIPDGIRVIDREYNVIMANTAFHNMLKLKKSCVGQKCYRAYNHSCEGCLQRQYACPIKELLQNSGDVSEHFHTIHEVGKRPLYLNATRLQWRNTPDDVYIVEAFHDLSNDIKFSHQQKISSLAFLSTSIAHEIKNNLGAIRMIFEGLLSSYYKDIPDTDDQKKYLLMAYNQLVETIKTPERLLRLVQYSENEETEIDIENTVKDILLMIDYEAKRHGISVKTQLEHNLKFKGNDADFKMIILNLTQNAIKAMPNGGNLILSTYMKNNNIFLDVKDTGTGISPDKLKHIFEPFYSANDSAKSSGLGLAIVSSLVEKMSGRITVKSKPDKGSTFTIRIPFGKNEKKRR
ncbi:MAG: ATP-binding protein [Pseudomonadota bacterium]|nr:ATP-binding protein [Pseudomonadota bacterium]